jgi:Ran GTPase-activating protein (RanGAP) involved in mRNA processing and transport
MTDAIRKVVWANEAGTRLLHVQGELDLTSKMWCRDLVKALSEDLNLGSIQIFDEGAMLISEAVGTNRTMVNIGLRDTRIGDSGALALAATLRENNTLQGLDLTDNAITDRGVAILARIILFRVLT